MKDADKTIARVLTGLRTAEPPAGIERRILDAMEARQVAAFPAPWGLRIAVGLCAAAILALWIVTITVRHQQPVSRDHIASVAPVPTNTPHQLPMIPTIQRRVHAHRRTPQARPQAVSFPAPPLPLTEQEKLLLRLAHKRDADNMAVLNPDKQAARMAKATNQFQQFFGIDPKEMRKQIE
jgi:hypothetical protein